MTPEFLSLSTIVRAVHAWPVTAELGPQTSHHAQSTQSTQFRAGVKLGTQSTQSRAGVKLGTDPGLDQIHQSSPVQLGKPSPAGPPDPVDRAGAPSHRVKAGPDPVKDPVF